MNATMTGNRRSSRHPALSALLALLLVLTMLLLAAVTQAQAAVDDIFTAENADGVPITYRVLTEDAGTSTGTVQVGPGATGADRWGNPICEPAVDMTLAGSLTIPETVVDGDITYTVTALGEEAFYQCSLITAVTLPDTVATAQDSAFQGCTSLTSVNIPASLTTIGAYMFHDCTSLTTLTIPSTVTGIGAYAFRGCSSLTTLTIPNTLKSIGAYAFQSCSSLTSLTIPDSVKSIGSNAFQSCSSLASLTLPSSLTTIEAFTFTACTSLTSFTIPSTVTSIGNNALNGCSGLTTLTIPASVRSIGNYAFGKTSLTSFTIPGTVESIGTNLFEGCAQLTSVTLPDSMKIPAGTFRDCTSLTSFTFPSAVTSIGNDTFYGCTGLTTLTIPSTVTSIGNNAFYHCTGLTSLTIPSTVTSIGDLAFSGCSSLTSLTIPSGVTAIGNSVFSGCTSLTTLTLPSTVTSIGTYAFHGCTSLTTLTLPSAVTSIGAYAFYNCTGLTSLTIPASVKSIGNTAFRGSAITTLIFLGQTAPTFTKSTLYDLPAEGTVYFPEGATGYTAAVFTAAMLPADWTLVEGIPSGPVAITGTTTITEGGEYLLDAALTGADITIATTEPVILTGRGIGDATLTGATSLANAGISVVGAVAGVDLTLNDVFINGPVSGKNVLSFTGAGNTLTFAGTSDLESTVALSLIHVPATAELTIAGEGTVYLYKSANGAGIGGDANEANGAITIDGPTIFAKGSKMGALIGGGGYTPTVPGDITIAGGVLNLIGNARGALIGTGASAAAAATPGNVYITGGSVNFNVDFAGSAIGNGDSSPIGGKAYITGGSVRAYIDTNAVSSWSGRGVTAPGVDPVAITAATLDARDEPTYMLAFDTGLLTPAENPPIYAMSALGQTAPDFTVAVDDTPYYEGGLHKYWFVQADKDKGLGEQISITTTPSNWIVDPDPDPDTNLYLFLTGTSHELTVNGETFTYAFDEETSTFSLVLEPEPTYDTSWYNTTDTSFELGTAAELAGLAAIVNGTAAGIAQDSFAGKTVTQTADIALEADGLLDTATGTFGSVSYPATFTYYTVKEGTKLWTPIGTGVATTNDSFSATNYFAGTYNGAGFDISGLYTDGTLTTQGLFGCVSGTVKNVNVTSGLVAAKIVAGGIAAYLNGGTIEGCSNSATVYADGGQAAGSGLENGVSRGGAIGGIVGNAAGSGDKPFTIVGCENTGDIVCSNTAKGGRAGGILGLIDNAAYVGSIKNNLNAGNVNAYQYSGGIVGFNYSKVAPIDACVNHGNTQNNSSGSTYGGGIVSQCYSDVSNCYNTGIYTGALWGGDKTAHLGGIVSDLYAPAKITNCYNVGHLALGGTAELSSSVGRIVGSGGGAHSTAAANVFNSYYLSIESELTEFADVEQGWLADDAEKTAEEMKSVAFVLALGDAYNLDTDGINDGYPVLDWQGGTAPEPIPEVGEPGSGDVDGDGAVTALDIVTLTRSVVGDLAELDDDQVAALDMDDDGVLTMADAIMLLRKAAGL